MPEQTNSTLTFDQLFRGIFDSEFSAVISPIDFLFCVGCALLIGLLLAFAFRYRAQCSRSFLVSLATLPAVVCVVIMMVNGNVGTGVAVAGAFSLVRFRSAQGSAREIGAIFIAMAAGLVTGMGYLGYAVLFSLIMAAISMVYTHLDFGTRRQTACNRTLRITIPEDLDYTGVFDDIFAAYTTVCTLTKVKTTNMGSLFKLTYDLTLRDPDKEKEMLDLLRCRNGNLEITVSHQETKTGEL